MWKWIVFIVVMLSCFSLRAQNNNILDVDFIESMTGKKKKDLKLLTSDARYANYLQILQENYEAKKPSKMLYNKESLIPKIMHQIWDGDMPPLYQSYLDECKKLHPDWEFKIWDEREIDSFNMRYRNSYDKARSYAAKADILRYEILYKFGGVYRDMDIKCLLPIDDLNYKYDFFIIAEGPYKSKYPLLNNGIIGSASGMNILKNTLESIETNIDEQLKQWDLNYKDTYLHGFAVESTLTPLTHQIMKSISLDDKIMAFPASYGMLVRNYSRAESFMWHNLEKSEIPDMHDKESKWYTSFVNWLERPKGLRADQLKIFNIFRAVYDQNSPRNTIWSRGGKIPADLNFIVFDADEEDALSKNLFNWKRLNPTFKITIWDRIKISKEFPEITNFDTSLKNLRFLIGLKIIEKFGGHHADFRAIPHKPIFELGNKYNFYAGMMPVTQFTSKILLSHKLLGANAHHPIITKTLSQIDPQNIQELSKLDEILTLEAYKNIYLDGKNIVWPAVYIEPIYDYEESFVNKIIRFATRLSKPFSQITRYVVVE
jgi:hypothetical protein